MSWISPGKDSPFLKPGLELKSNADVKAVQDICEYVYIDPERQKKALRVTPAQATSKKQPSSFAKAFDHSAATYQQTSELIKDVWYDIRFGNQFNVESLKAAVAECVDSVLENTNAMMLLTQLKNQDAYTSQHSLNVCILAIMLGKYKKFDITKLNQLGICGLLHDMGKMKVPPEVLNKPGKLDANELQIMMRHAEWGRDILKSARDVFPEAIEVAYSHHEKLDGSGYPRGITGENITSFTRIVAVVDAYDAITSDRVYKKGRLHLEAINILTDARHSQFDADNVIEFIDCIGIYPVGNLVELNNGEVAVVIEKNNKNKTRPKIVMLLDALKKPCARKIVDLDNNQADENGKTRSIYKVLHAKEYGLDLNKIQAQGEFSKIFASMDKPENIS